jgi:hypothetical protein
MAWSEPKKKSISWGNAEKRASDAAKRFDRTRAIVQKYQSRYGAAHSFFYLSTLAMLTSLQFFFLLLLYIELDMVKGERAFYKLNLSFYF